MDSTFSRGVTPADGDCLPLQHDRRAEREGRVALPGTPAAEEVDWIRAERACSVSFAAPSPSDKVDKTNESTLLRILLRDSTFSKGVYTNRWRLFFTLMPFAQN